jgi:superfamily II DNA or RNA helicase
MTVLKQALARQFDRAIQQRGAEYFRAGRVRIGRTSDTSVEATVRGTTAYHVLLLREEDALRVTCTCPYFDSDLCKHVWAAILAADQRLLLQSTELGPLRHVLHSMLDDEAENWEDEIESEGADEVDVSDFHLPFAAPTSSRSGKSKPPHWRAQLARLAQSLTDAYSPEPWPATRELLYMIDAAELQRGSSVPLDVAYRDRKQNGEWSKPRLRALQRSWLTTVPDEDRCILASLVGAAPDYGYSYAYSYAGGPSPSRFQLAGPLLEVVLPLICRTGRCRLRLHPHDEEPLWPVLSWDDGAPWELCVQVRRASDTHYEVSSVLSRGQERMDLSEPTALFSGGLLVARGAVSRFQDYGAFDWIALLREHAVLRVPSEQCDEFITVLYERCTVPRLELPEELRYTEVQCKPGLRLMVKPSPNSWERDKLRGVLSFDYDGFVVSAADARRSFMQVEQKRRVLRDAAAELAAQQRLQTAGWRMRAQYGAGHSLELPAKRLPQVVRQLTAEGWRIEAQGKLYRSAGEFKLAVSSGVDWFDLNATVEFDGVVAHLPQLLQALRRGETTVKLDDGSLGILPEEWLQKYGWFADAAEVREGLVRFKRSQLGLLDILLSTQPHATFDSTFAQARTALQSFNGIQSVGPPAGFRGELRPYQREGLGWLHFLQSFGFGGCLADDMGLGKTVQVLALLESRRALRASNQNIGPSLVVVPKSLVFNWEQEAARFAPKLRVLNHTGTARIKKGEHFGEYDLLITTYGTLRNDADEFKDVRFDYVILDEAQAIKNAASESAKAARLLRADHRLALSGTPVENHLGELWSLFEFLNPGMLGAASAFKLAQGAMRNVDEDTRRLLAQALRPFLLRRTKAQVLKDLPPKVEQTLYCELEGKQRKLYDELRRHYRDSLLKRIEGVGLARAKIQILEALLRLRQAAIHPGLIDKRRERDASAKLDLLLPQLREVLDEGHKTLVFSQFTGVLAIVRTQLDREKISYEYLDGKTRDREARVARFQSDPACKLFLISLKAGGTGLNLTAAQYVFLLDPWWNPAVEAQAIDRAHRIGQTNQVFAYRLIARDTIEEKVLQLQSAKRDLADATLTADSSLLRALNKEDLELLLS